MRKIVFFLLIFFIVSGVAGGKEDSLKISLREYTIGVLLSSRGDCEKAIPHFEKALSYHKSIYIYFELADCYNSLSDMEKTIEYLELAGKEYPNDPEAYLKLGDYYSDLVQVLQSPEVVKKSVENYRKAFELSHDYSIVYKIIEGYFLLQDYQNVLKYFNMLPESYKNDYYTLFYVAVAYQNNKDNFNLFITLKKLVRLTIPNPEILSRLASMSSENHYYLFAYRFLLELKAIVKDFKQNNLLCVSALMAGKYRDVIEMYERKFKASPTPVILYCVGTSYGYLNDYRRASEFYERVLKENTDSMNKSVLKDVYLDYIRIIIAEKNFKKAYKETLNYEKLYGLTPSTVVKERFEALILSGNLKEAKKVLYMLKIISDNSKFVNKIERVFQRKPALLGYDYLASLYYSLGDYKNSLHYFKKCLKIADKKETYLGQVALLYQVLKKPEKAEVYYRKLYKLNPTDPTMLNNYAYFLLENGKDLDKALKMAQRAVEEKPDSPSFRDTLGYAYLLNGDFKKAEENIVFAYKKSPMNPDICFHLGELYYRKKDYAKAKEYFMDAIDFGFSDVEVVKKRIDSIPSD